MVVHAPIIGIYINWFIPPAQVIALKNHKPTASDGYDRVEELMNKPVTEIDLTTYAAALESEKKTCATVHVDVRDAKRRINAAKGPRKSKKQQDAVAGSDADSDESAPM